MHKPTEKKKRSTRVHRNFKLPRQIDQALRSQAKKSRHTQTAILEIALAKHLGLA